MLLAPRSSLRGRCRGRCWGYLPGQHLDLPIILTAQVWIWRVWLLGFVSRIVSRINEGNIERSSEAKLDDRLLVGCPDPMRVICRLY